MLNLPKDKSPFDSALKCFAQGDLKNFTSHPERSDEGIASRVEGCVGEEIGFDEVRI